MDNSVTSMSNVGVAVKTARKPSYEGLPISTTGARGVVGGQFEPRLLLAEYRGVPEQDASA